MTQSAAHVFGSDLSIDATGNLALSSGSDQVRERIIRRLLTNPLGYLWSASYGAGLRTQIGGTLDPDQIQGLVASQLALEAGVDQTQPISVALVTDGLGTDLISISYYDAQDGSLQNALVPVSG